MSVVQDYLDLITSEHSDKPKFMAMVAAVVALPVQVQSLMTAMSGPLFDLDTPPVGNQEDIIGQWVGVSRNIETPITGVFFTWGGADSLGWGYGVWQDPNQPDALTTLPDDIYLTLVKARIASNNWDGTTEGAYAIWEIIFPNLKLLIQDNQNMSFIVAIQGTVIDSLTLALLTKGYLPLRPEGILISEYIIAVDTNPLFGWGMDTAYVQGWGAGSWGMELPPS